VPRLVISSSADLDRARERMCYLDGGRAPETDEDAAVLINQRGFLTLGAVKRLGLPNLSAADLERDWSVSWRAWRWKETLPAAGACAYLKWFRNQGTFIAWAMYPDFYAIWGPRGDSAEAFRSGTLTRREHEVLDLIDGAGPISSRDLWRRLRFSFGGQRGQLLSALTSLQRRFFVTVAGGDLERWSMHYWDLVPNVVPPGLLDYLPEPYAARANLVARAAGNLVLATPREIGSLFGWPASDVLAVAEQLASLGQVRLDVGMASQPTAVYIAPPDIELLVPSIRPS
jgi:hypothetical protein